MYQKMNSQQMNNSQQINSPISKSSNLMIGTYRYKPVSYEARSMFGHRICLQGGLWGKGFFKINEI